jgi:hypothetical protein
MRYRAFPEVVLERGEEVRDGARKESMTLDTKINHVFPNG